MRKMMILAVAVAGIAALGAQHAFIKAHQSEQVLTSLNRLVYAPGQMTQPDVKQLTPDDLPELLAALRQEDSLFDVTYEWLYEQLPDSVRSHLPVIYSAQVVRMNAAALVGFLGTEATPAVPQLIQLLQDDDADGNAALSLGRIGNAAGDSIPALITAMHDGRPFAALALAQVGATATWARTALEDEAHRGPQALREEAGHALKNLNPIQARR